jgi:hypothetical protein
VEQRSWARTQESGRPAAPVESLFERVQNRSAASALRHHAAGKIIGLLTCQALGEVMMIRAARLD